MKLRYILAQKFPQLGVIKRIWVALWHNLTPPKNSYSQHGEDAFLLALDNIDQNDIYIDVGANHPSDISNTYLFYRKGYKGILIEPNLELYLLNKFFRKRDISLPIGLSKSVGLTDFFISKTPVLSSIKPINEDSGFRKKVTIVTLTLDNLYDYLVKDHIKIFLLSIDTEGFNYDVLQSSKTLLSLVKYILIEFDNINEQNKINSFLNKMDFRLIKTTECNLIFERIK